MAKPITWKMKNLNAQISIGIWRISQRKLFSTVQPQNIQYIWGERVEADWISQLSEIPTKMEYLLPYQLSLPICGLFDSINEF